VAAPRPLPLLALLIGGCAAGAEVDVTASFDPSVSDADVARLSSIQVRVGGDEHAELEQSLPGAPAQRRLRFTYRSGLSSGALELQGVGLDQNREVFVSTEVAPVTLEAGRAVPLAITFKPGAPASQDMAIPGDGVLDGGPVDANIEAGGPVKCVGAGVILCDSFESPLINNLNWPDRDNQFGGDQAADAPVHYRGARALRAFINPPPPTAGVDMEELGYATAYLDRPTPTVLGPIHLRAFVYLPSSFWSGQPFAYSRLLERAGNFGTLGFGSGGSHQLGWGSQNIDSLTGGSSTATLGVDQWTCLEWSVTTGPLEPDGGAAGEIHVWRNQQEIAPLGFMGVRSSGFRSIQVGLEVLIAFGDAPLELYIDDVIVDDKYIGCDK